MNAESNPIRRDHQPFQVPIGERMSGGMQMRVRTLGEDWVVKSLRFPWKLYGKWESSMIDDIKVLQHYFGDFIPPTYAVHGENYTGKKDLLIVQKKIQNARPLKDLTHEEIIPLGEQLDDFTMRALRMQKEMERSPDLHGGFHPLLYTMYNFSTSENILVDAENKIWFVDVVTRGPMWEKNALGKLHTKLLRRSVLSFRKKLGLVNPE